MSEGILALAMRTLNHAFDPHISPAEGERRLLDLEAAMDDDAIAVLRNAELSRRSLSRLALEARLWLLHLRAAGLVGLRNAEINSLFEAATNPAAMTVTARAVVDALIEFEAEFEESADPPATVADAIRLMSEAITVEGGLEALREALEMARAARPAPHNPNDPGRPDRSP